MPLTIGQTLALLAETPRRIAELTSGLSAAHLRTAPAAGEWSANEVLAHLRACADVRGGAALTIVAEDWPTFRAIDPRRWIESTDYVDQEFADSLRAFAKQRADLLAVLETLPPDGWARSAIVTGTGRPLERTVLFYAAWVARHERPHVKQVRYIVHAIRRRGPARRARSSRDCRCSTDIAAPSSPRGTSSRK